MQGRLQNRELDDELVTVWALARPATVDFEGDLSQQSATSLARLYPPGYVEFEVARQVRANDLRILTTGRASLSFETTVGLLGSLFSARLEVATQPVFYGSDRVVQWAYLRFAIPPRLPRTLKRVLFEVGLPCPPTFARANPPQVAYHHLVLPHDLARCVHADSVSYHGAGVKVAIIDTGVFLDHEYFRSHPYQISTLLEPDATFDRLDEWGHGTALAAAVLAVAPQAELTMVKLPMERQDIGLRNHVTDALRHTLQQIKPDVVVCAWGFSENHPNLPKDLDSEIKAAIADDQVNFVCATGNGRSHFFPANLPEVIAVGGAHRHSTGIAASNFTSSFTSQVTGKPCPDIAGPSGDGTLGIYAMAPTGRVSFFDVLQYHEGLSYPHGDETQPGDGWCGIGGSSIAAAVVGGVVALIRSADPGATPAEVKSTLMATAESVRGGMSADGELSPKATGAGFVNARDAMQETLSRKLQRPAAGVSVDPNRPFGLPVRSWP
jgi:subtilisin family serine protease